LLVGLPGATSIGAAVARRFRFACREVSGVRAERDAAKAQKLSDDVARPAAACAPRVDVIARQVGRYSMPYSPPSTRLRAHRLLSLQCRLDLTHTAAGRDTGTLFSQAWEGSPATRGFLTAAKAADD